MSGEAGTIEWFVGTLCLTKDEAARLRAALDASADCDARLATSCATARVLSRFVLTDRLGDVVRRPLPVLDGRTLLQALIDEPDIAYRVATSSSHWSGTA